MFRQLLVYLRCKVFGTHNCHSYRVKVSYNPVHKMYKFSNQCMDCGKEISLKVPLVVLSDVLRREK